MTAPPRLPGKVILVAGLAVPADLALPRWLQAQGARVAVGGVGQDLLLQAQGAGLLALTLPPGDRRAAEIALAAVTDGLGGLDAVLHLPVTRAADAVRLAVEAALEQAVVAPQSIDESIFGDLAENVRLVHMIDGGSSPLQRALDGARRGWSEGLSAGGARPCRVVEAPAGLLDAPGRAALLDFLGQAAPPAGIGARLRRRLKRVGRRLQPPQTTSAAS